MANPRSKGIGDGAAQVYDYNRVDNAMNNALRMVGAKDERVAAKKDRDQAKKDKALSELRGSYGQYDTSNIREADKDVLINMIKEGRGEMEGHWEDVINGDPYWSNRYNDQVMAQKKFIGDSADAKKISNITFTKAEEPDSGFSETHKERLLKASMTPGITVNQLREQGLLSRDQIIGNIFNKVDDSLGTDGALYTEVDSTWGNPEGGGSKKGRKWLPDEEAKVKFKETISAAPEILTDMNIKYGDLPIEERYDAFYNDYKTSRIDEYMATNFQKKEPRDSGGGSRSGIAMVEPFEMANGTKGITFADPKKALTPISITIPKKGGSPERVAHVLPSEIYKDKKGKWRLRGTSKAKAWNTLTKEEQKKYKSEDKYLQTAETGDIVDQIIHDNVAAKIKAQYGISDYDQYLKGGTTKDGKTAEDLIKQYGK